MGPQIQLVGVQHIYFAFHVEWMDPSIEQWRFTLRCWDGMSPWNNIKRKFCTHAKSLQHKQYVLNLQAYEKRAAFGVQPSLGGQLGGQTMHHASTVTGNLKLENCKQPAWLLL